MASLDVQLPEQAVVYIGNLRTKITGNKRRYVRKKLRPGQVVTWQVRAEIMVNGNKIQKTKQVDLRAGTVSSLVFDFKDIETSLTLRVPSDAKVFLANAEKRGTGTIREFTSRKLAVGQKVSDYAVRVSVLRNGQLVSQERRISLTSGDSKTLSFRFDDEAPTAAVL